ncbi:MULTISPECIES: hypothetical protein [Streptomyces]|uniref:Uncharacterized protein n=1 Tax=Streptomyces glycanivorans TaxID=3033808 RepID=A0ABY9J4G7_9ACTN|nr:MULTISPECIES: hypothetical protein [unclassified Streptomyces]TXS15382.1 hypothetical protein EAO68_17615 [Streptomyces sp. wa22]WLQ62552.1 hypothetical protein P8A20_02645 [Streptomyces sp. Alt3]
MRAAAVRFVLAFLMSFLLAPYSGTASADAHASASGILAGGLPDATTAEAHIAHGPCGTAERGGEPNGLLRHRDRQRSATAPAAEAPPRSVAAQAAEGALAPAAFAAMGNAPHSSRSSGAHSSPALQVFRC